MIAERIPDRIFLPLLHALESHQGLTKGQKSEARAILERLVAFKVEIDDDGKRKAKIKGNRVHEDDRTKNEKRLLPLLLDYAGRDFQHDASKREMAQTPWQIEARANDEKIKAAEAEKLAEKATFDAKVSDAVNAATAPLLDLVAKLNARLDAAEVRHESARSGGTPGTPETQEPPPAPGANLPPSTPPAPGANLPPSTST